MAQLNSRPGATDAVADPADGASDAGIEPSDGVPTPADPPAGNARQRMTPPPAAGRARPVPTPENIGTPEGDASWDDHFDLMGDNGDCGDDDCDASCMPGCRRQGSFYTGVDYLLVKTRMSQNLAFVQQVHTTDTSTNPTTNRISETAIQFTNPYQSSFRAFLGYRLWDCGGDIQFTYWRLTGDGSAAGNGTTGVGTATNIGGQLELNAGNGQFIQARSSVTANIYDLDFAKCLSFGGPSSPCDTCFCPGWDVRWLAGLRVANINRHDDNIIGTTATGGATNFGNIHANFTGAGPRVGSQIRRYFGQRGVFSAYAKGNMALLVGDYHLDRTRLTPGQNLIETRHDSVARMIPVSEIEIGGSWQVAPRAFISTGWFFQAWWDLGQTEGIGGTNIGPMDTSNILAFDGWFLRGEILF